MLNRRNFFSVPGSPPAPPEGFWLNVNRSAMACRFEITLPGSEHNCVAAARSALDEIDKLEQQLTVFKETSEVSFVNRNAGLRPVEVTRSLFNLLLLSQKLYRETDHAFDVTSGPLSCCWGFMRRQGRIPEAEEIYKARASVGSEKVGLDHRAQTIRFDHPGVELNFGSIGKGYALDRVAALVGRRVRSALLSAGASSMRAIGRGNIGDQGWVVGIRHPNHLDKRMAVLRLRNCAMSTSGNEEQFFEHDGKRYGHIIDPRNGMPADGVSRVTVVARSAAMTDALSTAFYVGGPELAERYCAEHPGTLAIMLERDAGEAVVFGFNPDCEVELIDD